MDFTNGPILQNWFLCDKVYISCGFLFWCW